MDDKIEDGGPAFPYATTETNEHGLVFPYIEPGMSLRDYFAGQAITSILSERTIIGNECHLARFAYQVADAMMDARRNKS